MQGKSYEATVYAPISIISHSNKQILLIALYVFRKQVNQNSGKIRDDLARIVLQPNRAEITLHRPVVLKKRDPFQKRGRYRLRFSFRGEKALPGRRHQAGFLRVIREEETPRETEQLPVKALFRVALADTGNQDAGLIGQRRRAEARRCPGLYCGAHSICTAGEESTRFSYSSEKALR